MALLTIRKFSHQAKARKAKRISQLGGDRQDFSLQRNSLAAYWVHVLGGSKAPQSHHLDWIRLIETSRDSEALTMVAGPNLEIRGPRDSAKSTFAVVACAWIIGWNPGLRILYVSATDAVALEQSRKIKRLLASPQNREVFPWIQPGERWGEESWEIDKAWAVAHGDRPARARVNPRSELDATYTLYAAGATGSIMGKRADLVFCDDLIKSAEAIASPDVRSKMLDNLDGVVEPCLVPGGRWIDVGMLARRGDVHLTYFTQANGFHVHTTSAIQVDADGQERSYWGDRHPLETLQAKRLRAPRIFALQYQNEEPQDEDAAIILEDWIKWGVPPDKFDGFLLACDLASTEREASDPSAFVLFGRIKAPLQYWILEAHFFKESGNLGKFRVLSQIRTRIGPYRIVFESGAYQNSFEGDLREYRQTTDRSLVSCPVLGIPSSKDLRQRLTAVSGAVENGFVSWAIAGSGVEAVRHQVCNAHTDDLEHDDGASAFSLGLGALLGRGTGEVWGA